MSYIISLDDIREYNTHRIELPEPQKIALLVIEMQNVFVEDMKIISSEQISRINSLVSCFENFGGEVIYVRHSDDPEKSSNMISWWGDPIVFGSPSWQMLSEFNTNGKTIIDKNQYSAFHNTSLHNILNSKKISTVVITGVMTNCCCETTARHAFMYGYNVLFVNDATSTINSELHLASLKNIAFGFGEVVNTKNILESLNGTK